MITITLISIVFLVILVHTLLGCVIVPLQGALIIDAMGHSVVLGIIVGFLISHDFHSPYLFFGAACSGLLMNGINYILRKIPIISPDASVGISFSFLFALGILLISVYARNIHLDLDMILLGNVEYALYDTINIYGYNMPRIILVLLSSLVALLLFMKLFWNYIKVMLFDYVFAVTVGIPVSLIQIMLIILSSCVIVASFNVTGALILVGIAAGPFGYVWKTSTSFFEFVLKSCLLNFLCGMIGLFFSLYLDIPIAATVAFCITTINIMISLLCDK